jgi:hypothetical protein
MVRTCTTWIKLLHTMNYSIYEAYFSIYHTTFISTIDDSTQNDSYIDANQEFTRCENYPNILPLFGRLRRSLTSLLSSLTQEAYPDQAK